MTIDMTASSLRSEAETLPCRREDAELFFAESPADLELAKTLCHTCPVRAATALSPSKSPRRR